MGLGEGYADVCVCDMVRTYILLREVAAVNA